ncbi:MAG: bifunctional folylpolyglutamate synthase/dihydrofolate synthase [Acidimicrobiia bacterium]|nr:bifunctional folylpolyglutamate synthase/dihydrofolate synthase [Acidimicrobiia bacterium]
MTAPFDRLFALEAFGVKLGLNNITTLCEALGHPERRGASVLIAGTNGKGSVAAMVHAGLHAAGVRTALYTSPHLSHLRERFTVGGSWVADDRLAAVAQTVLDTADALVRTGRLAAPPTFFEATTAMAFELFARDGVEIAVLEVGLGGRFDATNVVSPAVTAITSIGLDHQAQLGSTVEAIAFEKAGIIKAGAPVVLGRLPLAARAVVHAVAAERGAGVVDARDLPSLQATMADGHASLDVETPVHRYTRIRLALAGEHQIDNALVALRVLETLGQAVARVPPEAVARGLATVSWPGRLETVVVGSGRLILDAAHNPDGASVLAAHLARWHPERPTLLFGVLRDKDVRAMLTALLPACGPIVVTSPPSPRARDPDEVAALVRTLDPGRDVRAVRDPAAAIGRAIDSDSTVCVAGSVFLIGAVREALNVRAMLR